MKTKLLSLAVFFMAFTFSVKAETPPAGYVSVYSLIPDAELAPLSVAAKASPQLLGPANGWGSNTNYDLSNYEKIELKITFDAADAGNQVALRFSVNGSAKAVIFTLPAEGTSYIAEVPLAGYANAQGQILSGGMVFYNGSTHWSFTYTGTAASKAVTIEYVALKKIAPTGLVIVPVDESQATALALGSSTTLNVQFSPANTTNKNVTWSSANENIATVSEAGLVQAGNSVAGPVVITATSQENSAVSAQYTVTVIASTISLNGISLTEPTASLKLGRTKTMTAVFSPSNASNKNVTWASSDESVATVDAQGVVTPKSSGPTTITVTAADGGFSAECQLTVLGYTPIPEGYVSLYSLQYNNEGSMVDLSATTLAPGANVPAIFNCNESSLLGTVADWNRANKYCDLTNYSELKVGTVFNTADIGKKFIFRYAFSTAAGSQITNREVTIESENQTLVIDLNNDPADLDDLKRVGALKFRNSADGVVTFDIDYVAVKTLSTSVSKNIIDNPDALVNVYTITGMLIRQNVKQSEIHNQLEEGFYIINNKKVLIVR